jgi:cytidylate kinase
VPARVSAADNSSPGGRFDTSSGVHIPIFSLSGSAMPNMTIAIDGPSGAGKSSLGKELARRLGYLYIDSGAVYRAIGSQALYSGVSLDDPTALAGLAHDCLVHLDGDPDHLLVFVDGRDVTERIRLPDATRAASVVATIPAVREAVVQKLRKMSENRGVVMDGRDIGTRVFPDATVKLFLDASPDARSQRRWAEEVARGRAVQPEDIKAELDERDRRDRQRAATPLVMASDAVLIDTSNVSLDQVVRTALEIIRAHR